MGALLRASVGFCPLVAPLLCFGDFFGAVLIWAVLSLPSFVLGLVFCFLSCVASLCLCLPGVVVLLFVGGGASSFLSIVWLLLVPLPGRLMLPFPLRLVACGVLV